MLLYTRSVASRYTRDPEDLLALAVDESNETFRNSGLSNIRLRLVHTELIDYDASADDQFNHLYAMVDGVGPFKDVKKLRNEKRADIVGLIIDNPTGWASLRASARNWTSLLCGASRVCHDHLVGRPRNRTYSWSAARSLCR